MASVGKEDHFGDFLGMKTKEDMRVVLLNVDNLPDRRNSEKTEQILDWWAKDEVDVALFTETARHWPTVPHEERWDKEISQRVRGGVCSSMACNCLQTRTNNSSTPQ